MHRHVRRIGDQVAVGVEQRAGEVQALLDVDGVRRVLQTQAHLLGNVHEQVVEDLKHHRVGVGADGVLRGARLHARQFDRAVAHQPGLPSRLDHGGGVLLGHDGRAIDAGARAQAFAHIQAGVLPAAAVHAHRGVGRGRVGRRLVATRRRIEALTRANRFDRHCFDHQAAAWHQEGKALPVAGLEGAADLVDAAEGQHQCGISALVAQVHLAAQLDGRGRNALAADFVARGLPQLRQARCRGGQAGRVERQLQCGFAHRNLVGQAHAVGRQHARHRVHEDAAHAERVGHAAGMLATGAAEALQGVLGHVVAARHRDALDRVGHVLDRDLQETLGQRFSAGRAPAGLAHALGQGFELRHHALAVERLIAPRAKDFRKVGRRDLAQQHVGIGGGQWPAAAVAGRAWIRACALGADTQARAVELQQRAAASGDGVDAHHGRAHAHAGHLGFEGAFELAGVVRHIGAGAAHVEADHLGVTAGHCRAHHADDAAGRARQDRVLALEAVGLRQATAALHEVQGHAGHLAGDLIDITTQDR